MPRCHPISMLRLDSASHQGLKRIRQLESSAKISAVVLSGGQVMLLIFKQSRGEMAINISTKDWEDFFSSLQGIPKAFREQIIQEAEIQQLNHHDRAQSEFWRSVAEGCLEITR